MYKIKILIISGFLVLIPVFPANADPALAQLVLQIYSDLTSVEDNGEDTKCGEDNAAEGEGCRIGEDPDPGASPA